MTPRARAILSGTALERALAERRAQGLPPVDVAVIVDVLRATTTLVHAFAHGAQSARAFTSADEARLAREGMPPGSVLLCGERGGVRVPGFDLGNSPREYVSDFVRGRALLVCTTNGTRALARTREARRQLAAAFVNADATARRVRALAAEAPEGARFEVWIVAAGENDVASDEDSLCALLILDTLATGTPGFEVTVEPGDEAAVDTVLAHGTARLTDETALADFLAQTGHGRALVEVDPGFARDVRDAARRDLFDVVPEGRGGTLDSAARVPRDAA